MRRLPLKNGLVDALLAQTGCGTQFEDLLLFNGLIGARHPRNSCKRYERAAT